MDFRLMVLNIKQFCPQLSVPVIKQRVNVRYQQVLGYEDWEFLKDSTTINVIGVTSNTSSQSCAVTNASATVTGTGTAWTSALVGYSFRVGTEAQPYEVSAVGGLTSLTLTTTYGGDTATGEDFSYWPKVYSPSVSDVGEITSVVYQTELREVSEAFLNQLDPERESTGSPMYWRVVSKASALGTVSIEIYPPACEDYVVTVNYKKTVSDLAADTDEPVFRSEVLEAGALWDCYRLVYGVTQNPAYIGMARDAQTEFQMLLRQMTIEDLSTASLPRRVRNTGGGMWFGDDFNVSHDIWGV